MLILYENFNSIFIKSPPYRLINSNILITNISNIMRATKFLNPIALLFLMTITFAQNENNFSYDEDIYLQNYFLSSQTSKYYLSSGDLSFQELNLAFDLSKSEVYVGKQFALDKSDYYDNLLEIGLKGKLNEGFSTLFKNGEIQNNIGIAINYKYINKKALEYVNREDEVNNLLQTNQFSINNEAPKNALSRAYLIENTQLVVSQIIDNGYFDKAAMNWFTFQLYVPLASSEYNVLPLVTSNTLKTESYFPVLVNLGWTTFCQKTKNKSMLLSIAGEVKNTNTVETKDLTKYSLQTFDSQNNSLLSSSKTVYVGDFETFFSSSLTIEAVSFFILNQIGLSGQIEKNFGEYDATNWKLGIPFNLKGKVSGPNINFELAWREINKEHFVGINVGFAFSNIIK